MRDVGAAIDALVASGMDEEEAAALIASDMYEEEEVPPTKCVACGQEVEGWAFVGDHRVCHPDEERAVR